MHRSRDANRSDPDGVALLGLGLPPLFKPAESLAAYGDKRWLAGAVDEISRELARTKFHLQSTNAKGESDRQKAPGDGDAQSPTAGEDGHEQTGRRSIVRDRQRVSRSNVRA